MTRKTTFQDLQNLAQSRGQTVISITDTITPSKGSLTLHCNKCGNDFTNTVFNYKNAKVTGGCPTCFRKIKQVNSSKPRTSTPEVYNRRKRRQEYIQQQKQQLGKKYQMIQSRENLIDYLKQENNMYSQFILERLDKPVPTDRKVEKHHIIPLHAGGPDVPWNLMSLTLDDHNEAHHIRESVYNEPGDKSANQLRAMQSPEGQSIDERVQERQQRGDQTRRKQKKGIYAKGASQRGGQIGGRVQTDAKIARYQEKMTDEVRSLLENGSTWLHEKTGTQITFEPGELKTMVYLMKALGEVLPEGHSDRESLLGAPKPANVTSALGKVIKKERPRAYGWKIV